MKLFLSGAAELAARYGRAFRLAWQQRDTLNAPRRTSEEAEFLPAVLSLQDTPSHPAPHIAIWSLITLSGIALVWATLGTIDIVAVANGQVIPAGNTKTLQAPDDATITGIRVENGQKVQAGDIVMTLDAEAATAEVQRLKSALGAAQLQSAQGQAMVKALHDGHTPQLSSVPGVDTQLWHEAQQRLQSQYQQYLSQYRQLDAQINQQRQQQFSLNQQLANIAQSLPLLRQQEADYQAILNKDFLPRHTFIDKQRQRIELEGNQITLSTRLQELNAAIRTLREQQASLRAETVRAAQDTVQQGMEHSRELEQEAVKAKRTERQMIIRTPVTGTVQQLAVHTIGGVVTPAQALMAIVPENASVEVEAFIDNKDIGFVRVNQPVAIKIDTFKFTQYGTIPGHVTSLSQDAIPDEKRGPIFSARIQLDKDWLNIDGQKVHLSPGMAVSAEIRTGHRRLIDYFLTPLLQHGQESLKER